MSLIQCAKNCDYQTDGYCMLDKISIVTNTEGGCPHYILSKNSGDSIPEISNRDNLNTENILADLL